MALASPRRQLLRHLQLLQRSRQQSHTFSTSRTHNADFTHAVCRLQYLPYLFFIILTWRNDQVIGGGVVGLAIARQLAARQGTSTILLEKHDAVGTETSSRNSEVLLMIPPFTLARLTEYRSSMQAYTTPPTLSKPASVSKAKTNYTPTASRNRSHTGTQRNGSSPKTRLNGKHV
jgi:hypothetical protein